MLTRRSESGTAIGTGCGPPRLCLLATAVDGLGSVTDSHHSDAGRLPDEACICIGEDTVNIAQQASAKEARPIVEEDIRTRAYEIWEDEGRPHGRHLDHWRRAIDEVSPSATAPAQSNGASAAGKRTAKPKTEASDEAVASKAPKKAAAASNGAKPAAPRTAKSKTTNGAEARAR
jgi:DUF2934 family protein